VSGTVTDSTTGKLIDDFLMTPRYALANRTPSVVGEWEEYDGERFQGGSCDLWYDHSLPVGSIAPPGWQFLIEAEGYEPFVTRVLRNDDCSAQLVCRLSPLVDHIGATAKP
jgi:hypothetical protein